MLPAAVSLQPAALAAGGLRGKESPVPGRPGCFRPARATVVAKGAWGTVSGIASPFTSIHRPVSASRSSATGGSSPVGIGPTSSSSEPPVAATPTSVCTMVLVVLYVSLGV